MANKFKVGHLPALQHALASMAESELTLTQLSNVLEHRYSSQIPSSKPKAGVPGEWCR